MVQWQSSWWSHRLWALCSEQDKCALFMHYTYICVFDGMRCHVIEKTSIFCILCLLWCCNLPTVVYRVIHACKGGGGEWGKRSPKWFWRKRSATKVACAMKACQCGFPVFETPNNSKCLHSWIFSPSIAPTENGAFRLFNGFACCYWVQTVSAVFQFCSKLNLLRKFLTWFE